MEAKYAVLIGNSEFPHEPGLNPLRCPPRDVEGMASVFESDLHGGYLTARAVNHDSLSAKRLISRTLSKAEPDDVVLIYYSGHGKLDEDGNLYLATADTIIDELLISSVPIKDIREMMRRSRSAKIVLILDCCFSGAVEAAFGYRGDVGTQASKILPESLAGRGTYILTASTEIQRAQERESDEFGLLTKHIITGIKEGLADADDDGLVSMRELLQYVQMQVRMEGSQEPQGYALKVGGGDLAIAKTGKAPRAMRRQMVLECIYQAALAKRVPSAIIRSALFIVDAPASISSDVRDLCDREFAVLYNACHEANSFLDQLWNVTKTIDKIEQVQQAQLELARAKLSRIATQLDEQLKTNAMLASRVEAIETTKGDCLTEVEELRAERVGLMSRTKELGSLETELRKELEGLKERLDASESARLDVTFERDHVALQLRDAIATNDGLQSRIAEVTREGERTRVSLDELLKARSGNRLESRIQVITSFFVKYSKATNVHILPRVPSELAATARQFCLVPASETIAVLVDCSIVGTGREALVFCPERMYYSNRGSSGAVEYVATGPASGLKVIHSGALYISRDKHVDLNGAPFDARELMAIFIQLSTAMKAL